MFKLVIKDLLIHKSMIVIVVIYEVLLTIVSSFVKDFSSFLYTLGAVLITILAVSMTNYYDDKNNTDILLASFPVERSEIVIGKYFSFLVFLIINLGVMQVCIWGYNIVRLDDMIQLLSVKNCIYSFYIVSFLFSFYYPLLFKYGYIKMRVVNVILYLFVLIIPRVMQELGTRIVTKENLFKVVEKIEPVIKTVTKYPFLISLFFIAILFVSIQFSIKIYRHREMY